MSIRRALELKCSVMNYDWGKLGKNSLVARLQNDEVSETKPYAELWAGAHPKAPAEILIDSKSSPLDEFLESNSVELLGANKKTLPFLFKALSINTALSIQAHPDKKLAEKLHQNDPSNYPDDNHKPEIAIALTEVELLYGFKPYLEIANAFKKVPELSRLVPHEFIQEFLKLGHGNPDTHKSLKKIYSAILNSSKSDIAFASEHLYERLKLKGAPTPEAKWILKLRDKFPEGDIGLYSFFLLNYERLLPAEAVFVEPNTPHAYLSGDLVECMANSDNVVRAGLTTKFCDVETLSEMLSYRDCKVDKLEPVTVNGGWKQYQTPAEEFLVYKSYSSKCSVKDNKTLNILLSIDAEGELECEGEKHRVSTGSCYLIPASVAEFKLEISGSLFRATSNF